MSGINSGPSVPMSKHQLGKHQQEFSLLAPGSGELHSARCVVLDVYEQAVLEDEDLPPDIKKQLDRFPNKLFAKIRLEDGRILYRPFRDPQSQIFSTYGNSTVLRGAPAKIYFHNTRVREGQIVLTDDFVAQPVHLELAVESWDIGRLI